MTTIKEIAKLAGVSRSTVSRVLNDDENVSDQTRVKVQTIINKTGYQPSPVARSLISGRTQVIGLVVPMVVSSLFRDPFFSILAQGISST
ncbi:MAG: LacI family DNA-binding transcriptional regulator, partial [Brevefilum sp.]